MTTEPHGSAETTTANQAASAPANSTTQATQAIEVSEAASLIASRRAELGIEPGGSRPAARSLETVCAEVLAKNERAKPTEADLDAMERRADAERAAERRYRQQNAWRSLVAARGERYADCRLANYQATTDAQNAALERVRGFCESMPEYYGDGRGIVFYGPAGTGKDHLLTAALRYAVLKHGYEPLWVNGMDLYGSFRDAIGGDRDEHSMLSRYIDADILAISDPLPPFGTLTDFQASMLFRVVDGRYARLRPTWATMNVKDGKEAGERLGVQILDRLKHGSLAIDCNWPSFRKVAQ